MLSVVSPSDVSSRAISWHGALVMCRTACPDILEASHLDAITKSQLDRLMKAYEAKKVRIINMSEIQFVYNMKIEGGFLPGLIPFLTGTVLPALGVGALSGLASADVQKLIGNGLYLKKGGSMCQIRTDRKALYIGPRSGKRFETVGMVFT